MYDGEGMGMDHCDSGSRGDNSRANLRLTLNAWAKGQNTKTVIVARIDPDLNI